MYLTKKQKDEFRMVILKEIFKWQGVRMQFKYRVKYGQYLLTIELDDLLKIMKIKKEHENRTKNN